MCTILYIYQFLHNTFIAHDALFCCEVGTLSQRMHLFGCNLFNLILTRPILRLILVFVLHCNYDLLFVFLGCH